MFKYWLVVVVALVQMACSDSPQSGDPDYTPQPRLASFSPERSPVVLVDEAHHNFLTIDGRYQPFAQVLASDGLTVRANKEPFTQTLLASADVVVIANALDSPRTDWQPPFGIAFSEDEVAVVQAWVRSGGALLLIADHTPFPKVIANLANAFGFEFSNGHVTDKTFRLADTSLHEHAITAGINGNITQVKTFGGSAFSPPPEATVLLELGDGAVSLEPAIPFQINRQTKRIDIAGWSQGAVLEYGAGRVAVFAEGMMFSSQLDAQTKQIYGFTSLGAEQNEAFLINLMHWLVGVI